MHSALIAHDDDMPDDMFCADAVDPRTEVDPVADEKSTLVGFLQWQRDTLALKCSGLDPEAMARRSVAPSVMSLLGVLRHMAEVEHDWFRAGMAGEPSAPHYRTADDPDADWNGAAADPVLVTQAWDVWRSEIAHSEQFVAEAPDLDITGIERWRGATSLRWVLVHLIEEYARHVGHADLLRERIDGAVGQ